MAKRSLRGSPESHAERIADIHGQIEQGLRERFEPDPGVRFSCRVALDQIRALEERVGRAQGHLDGVAGSSSATTTMFKTQKKLASKVGTLSTHFLQKCSRTAR